MPYPIRRLDGKVVVITGASAGVGRATARRFAREGAAVALVGRDSDALDDTRRELEQFGHRISCHVADVSDADAIEAAAGDIESTFGPIEVWVNNAMLTVFSPVSEMTPEEFRKVTETTYLGYVYGTMAALRRMRRRNRGVIVQVGSSLSYRGIPLQSAYCGAKHAIRGFTDALRAELLHEHSQVGVTMVQLPAVNTPQFDWARTHFDNAPAPVPPIVEPEVAANAILNAVLTGGREHWIDFSTMKVIVGSFVAPTFLDHFLAKNAYDAQISSMRPITDPAGNLDHPVRGLHRTRGRFGQNAKTLHAILHRQPGPRPACRRQRHDRRRSDRCGRVCG